MNCNCSGMGKFVAGMATGLVAGTAIGMTMCPTRRELKRATNKAAKHVSEMIDHLTAAMEM